MNRISDPSVSFFIVLLIGILAGWIAQTIARTSWLSKQIVGSGRVYLTSVLVGIAGAFICFHLAGLLHLGPPTSFVPFVGAVIGAALILVGWRAIRI